MGYQDEAYGVKDEGYGEFLRLWICKGSYIRTKDMGNPRKAIEKQWGELSPYLYTLSIVSPAKHCLVMIYSSWKFTALAVPGCS